MAKTRRSYTGASVSTTTSSAIAASGTTTFTVSAATNWPYGTDPFYVVLSPGTASEEKILVTRTNTGDTTLNISSDVVRGLDGTSAVSHDAGATVYPVFTAVDADEANELASMWESKGDIVSHGASTFARLAVGSDDTVLIADSSASSGLAWGQVDTVNIANDAVTNAKIDAAAVDTAELAANAVTETKLDSAVVSKLLPAGTIAATIKSSADTGWLLLDGSTVASASSTYPALWAVVPVSWQSGTSLVLPNMADKMLFGQSTTTLGASGGANSKTIAEANLPTHTHTIHHGHGNSFSLSQTNHSHTVDPDSATTGNPSVDVVHRKGDGYIVPTAEGQSYRIPDQHLDPVSNGMQIYANTFDHTHTIDLPSKTSSGANANVTLSGSVTDNTTSSSGNGGFANNALDVTNAHLAVNFQIKAH